MSISANQSCSIYNGVHENMAINASNIGDCVARSRSEDHTCLIANFIDVLSLYKCKYPLLLSVYLFSGESPMRFYMLVNILYNNTKN